MIKLEQLFATLYRLTMAWVWSPCILTAGLSNSWAAMPNPVAKEYKVTQKSHLLSLELGPVFGNVR